MRPRLPTAALLLTVVGFALALPSCRSAWTRAPAGGADLACGEFTARVPAGWMVSSAGGSAHRTLTLDGTDIHFISFTVAELDEAFPALERGATPDMLPSELAEATVAELKASGFDNLEVISEGPALVAGQEAFRLHLRHRQPTGLRFDHSILGFATEGGAYRLVYSAPTLYFFERDLLAYEELVDSVRPKADTIPAR